MVAVERNYDGGAAVEHPRDSHERHLQCAWSAPGADERERNHHHEDVRLARAVHEQLAGGDDVFLSEFRAGEASRADADFRGALWTLPFRYDANGSGLLGGRYAWGSPWSDSPFGHDDLDQLRIQLGIALPD